jgi:serine/threonine-protein kinase
LQIRRLTASQYARVSALLDESIELTPSARQQWLARLSESDPAVAELVRRLWTPSSKSDVCPATDNLLDRYLTRLSGDDDVCGRRFGPYRVLASLGKGGMGSVWLAERVDGQFARQVALKLVHRALVGGETAQRFARERDILAALTHPNIARLYDAGMSSDGQPYLAMEYVQGEAIVGYCDGHRLTLRERLSLFLEVLAAVQHAHAHLIIHRDLKPSNILVTADRRVLLLDFGIAKLLRNGKAQETALTQLGGRALTPDYASPEQIAGEPLSTSSDVYSLGVLLYELLTGARPYRLKRMSPAALEEAIVSSDPQRPSQAVADPRIAERRATALKKIRATLAGDLDTILLKALKKRASERYATVDAFRQDIERFLAGRAVLAKPDTFWYRARKFLGRNRLAAGASAVVLLALLAGLGAALSQADRARQQARIAQEHARTAEAVQGFMEDLFEANTADQTTPEAARNMTARELLDRGSSKIQAALNDTPSAKLRVLRTLSQMYNGLDLNNRAAELARERVTLARTLYGPADVRLAQALVDFGDIANSGDLLDEGGKALLEAERILDHAGDYASGTRGKLDGQLAYHYESAGDWPRSLFYAKQAIQLLRPQGPSYDLVFALFVQAGCSADAGDPRTAKAAAMEADSLVTATHGRINSLAPGIYAQLGYAQTELAEFADAELSLRRAVSASQSIIGPETLDTIEMQRTLGDFLWKTSRLDQALQVLAPAREVALKIRARGETSILPALLLIKEARLLIEYGRFEQAVPDIEAVQRMHSTLGTASWFDARLQEVQARAWIEGGNYGEAARALAQAEATERSLGWQEMMLFNDNVVLRTRLLLAEGAGDEAARTFAQYRVVNHESNPSFLARLEQTVTMSEINLAQGALETAAAQAAAVRGEYLSSDNRSYLRTYEARVLMVEGKVRLLTHQSREAVALLQQAVALSREIYNTAESPVLADAEIALARAHLATGDRKRASELSAEVRAIHARHRDLGEHYRRPLRELEGAMAARSAS